MNFIVLTQCRFYFVISIKNTDDGWCIVSLVAVVNRVLLL